MPTFSWAELNWNLDRPKWTKVRLLFQTPNLIAVLQPFLIQFIFWNEYVTIAVNRNLSNCEIVRKKGFRGFNGIRTRGLCISAAVLYQPELWRPIHWRPANLLSSSTRERNETQNEMMWTAGIQMKWICDHRSESQFMQLRNSPPKKRFSGLQRDSIPWPLR